jgi:myo-inositol-1(or 4)-monophosphatase
MNLDKTLDIASDIAQQAGKLLMQLSGKVQGIRQKGKGNFVSEADKKAEELILEKLQQHFPGSSFLAEESGEIDTSHELTWVIDPLDGTTNYLHGFPHWAVSIGALWKNKPFLGVIYHPPLNEIFTAVLGRGSRLNRHKINVSKVRRLPESLLATGFAYDTGEALRRSMKLFKAFQDHGQSLRRPGAAALDLAAVAAGRFDGFWESGLKAWDSCAGIVLIAEAGGKISDYTGKPYHPGDPDLCVSNGLLHEEMLRRFKNLI